MLHLDSCNNYRVLGLGWAGLGWRQFKFAFSGRSGVWCDDQLGEAGRGWARETICILIISPPPPLHCSLHCQWLATLWRIRRLTITIALHCPECPALSCIKRLLWTHDRTSSLIKTMLLASHMVATVCGCAAAALQCPGG